MMQPWKKISEKVLHEHYRTFLEKTFELPNGKVEVFDTIKERDFASVLAITEKNTILLCRQFRPGAEDFYDELPGGFIEGGATPEETARKELLEETGYEGKLRFVGTAGESGYSSTTNYCFVATGCRKVGTQKLDQSEFIELIELSLPEFRKFLREGKCATKIAGFLGLEAVGLL